MAMHADDEPNSSVTDKIRTLLLHAVAGHPLITESDVNLILPYVSLRNFQKGETYMIAAPRQKEIFYPLAGVVRSFYLLNDREINDNFGFENEFMLMNCTGDPPAGASFVEALEPAELLHFTPRGIEVAERVSPNWDSFIKQLVEAELNRVSSKIKYLLAYDGRERYLRLIRENSRIFSRVPLYHIASFLGIEKETLSRLRKKISVREIQPFEQEEPLRYQQKAGL